MRRTALARIGREGPPAIPEDARQYIEAATAESTRRAYRSDWEHFVSWCMERKAEPLPATPELAADYAACLAAQYRVSTIERRLAAISKVHQAAGVEPPTRSLLVRETMKGIRRKVGVAPTRKAAIRVLHLRQWAQGLPDGLQGLRDRALVLLGYAGAFRRSELVGLDVADVEITLEGAKVILRRSKTDQEGEGQVKAIGYGLHPKTCPVKAVQEWLSSAGITAGPIFRAVDRHGHLSEGRLSDKAVGLVVKRLAVSIGLDPEQVGGHSLRAGFTTDEYHAGTSEALIQSQTGHKSSTVLRQYRREADLFAFNFSAAVGL